MCDWKNLDKNLEKLRLNILKIKKYQLRIQI